MTTRNDEGMGNLGKIMHFVRPELRSRHSGYGYGFGFGYGALLKSFIRIIATLIFSRKQKTQHNTTRSSSPLGRK